MSPSRNRFVLIFLLTLLQCFAPLLHAHTHGSPVASGVHIYGVDELAVADSSKPAFTAERGESAPAIAMAQEYRQDSAIALPDAMNLFWQRQPYPFPQFFSGCRFWRLLFVSHPLAGR